MPERVVVTGLGILSPLGLTARAHYAAACAGQSGVRPIRRFDVSGMRTQFAGSVEAKDFVETLGAADCRVMDRFAQMAVIAARGALEDAGLRPGDRPGEDNLDPDRTGVCLGTAQGGRVADEFLMDSYFKAGKVRQGNAIPLIMPSSATAWVSVRCQARGPATSISTACTAGVQSLGLGARMVASGEADVVLAGAADAPLARHMLSAWALTRATSARNDNPAQASRPFDVARDGFVLSEGAAVLTLESATRAMARGARIYAEIVGQGHSADAFDIVAPDPSGAGAVRAIRAALTSAGAVPGDVTLISAHGTSTKLNDVSEARALHEVFGIEGRAAVMSLKALTGHAMGASGAIEVATLAMVLSEGIIPPHPNLTDIDPLCRLNHVAVTAGRYQSGLALANSFGFGGANSCLVLAPWK